MISHLFWSLEDLLSDASSRRVVSTYRRLVSLSLYSITLSLHTSTCRQWRCQDNDWLQWLSDGRIDWHICRVSRNNRTVDNIVPLSLAVSESGPNLTQCFFGVSSPNRTLICSAVFAQCSLGGVFFLFHEYRTSGGGTAAVWTRNSVTAGGHATQIAPAHSAVWTGLQSVVM